MYVDEYNQTCVSLIFIMNGTQFYFMKSIIEMENMTICRDVFKYVFLMKSSKRDGYFISLLSRSKLFNLVKMHLNRYLRKKSQRNKTLKYVEAAEAGLTKYLLD